MTPDTHAKVIRFALHIWWTSKWIQIERPEGNIIYFFDIFQSWANKNKNITITHLKYLFKFKKILKYDIDFCPTEWKFQALHFLIYKIQLLMLLIKTLYCWFLLLKVLPFSKLLPYFWFYVYQRMHGSQ